MRTISRPGIFCLGIVSTLLALEYDASAQDVRGAFRLGFEGVLFAQDSMTVSPSDSSPKVGPGGLITTPPDSVTVKNTSAGILPSTLGLGLGFAPSSNVVLGMHTVFAKTTTEVDIEGVKPASGTQYSVLPSIELMAASGQVRPFVEARFGWRGSSTEVDGEETSTSSALVAGGGVGLHLFANDHVSIDPGFHAYFLSGSYKSGDLEMDGSGHTLMMSLALSAWLGGGRSEHEHDEPAPAYRHSDSSASVGNRRAETTPDDIPARVDSRMVQTTISVGEQSSLFITGVPDKNGDVMLMQWRATGQPPWKRECKTLKLVLDGTDYPLSKVTHRSGGEAHGTWMGIGGQIGAHTVVALSEASESRLVACNASLGLYSVRKFVRDYVVRFREAATDAGTWQEPEPQPPAQPEPPPAADPTQPPTEASATPSPETPAPAATEKKEPAATGKQKKK